MGATTAISWADHTFNAWIGCTKVSPACDGCYAENLMATRYHRVVWGAPGQGEGTRVRTSAANWGHPRAWDRKAKATGTRPFVFCASLADVFDNAVPPEWRRDLFQLIRATPNLTWLLLTKRPALIVREFNRIVATTNGPADLSGWPRNAAIGCTVVTQEEADRDVPKLLAAKAALNPAFAFVSMEPLLGPVDLTALDINGDSEMDALNPTPWSDVVDQWRGTSETWEDDFKDWFSLGDLPSEGVLHPTLDWVITGGETDQGQHEARPSHPDWFRALRDQCAAAGVAYHHKQNGEWRIGDGFEAHFKPTIVKPWTRVGSEREGVRPQFMVKHGKRLAGRALDGVIHDARPVLG